MNVDDINSCLDLVHAQPPVQPLVQVIALLFQNTPRPWLKIRRNMRCYHTDVLQTILDALGEAQQCSIEILKHTEETPTLTSQEQRLVNTFVLDCIKARQYVIVYLYDKIQEFATSLTNAPAKTWNVLPSNVFSWRPSKPDRELCSIWAICQFGSQKLLMSNSKSAISLITGFADNLEVCLDRVYVCRENLSLLLTPHQEDCDEIFRAMKAIIRRLRDYGNREWFGPRIEQLLILKEAFRASKSSRLLYRFHLVGPEPCGFKHFVQYRWCLNLWRLHRLICGESYVNDYLSPITEKCGIPGHILILRRLSQRAGFKEITILPDNHHVATEGLDKECQWNSSKKQRMLKKSADLHAQLAIETQHFYDVSHRIKALSVLTIFFLPLSFSTSFLAMNGWGESVRNGDPQICSHFCWSISTESLLLMVLGFVVVFPITLGYAGGSQMVTKTLSALASKTSSVFRGTQPWLLDRWSSWSSIRVKLQKDNHRKTQSFCRVIADPLAYHKSARTRAWTNHSWKNMRKSLIKRLLCLPHLASSICNPLPPLDPSKVRVRWTCVSLRQSFPRLR